MRNYIPMVLVLGLMILCYWNLFRKKLAPVKKVKAQLVEKYTYNAVSRTNPNAKVYVLVFETDKGRLSFNVPEFSYGGYKLKKRGTLKYKGDMILEFK